MVATSMQAALAQRRLLRQSGWLPSNIWSSFTWDPSTQDMQVDPVMERMFGGMNQLTRMNVSLCPVTRNQSEFPISNI